uniref:Uncharacterized protein n=1 Tax=Amphimedon queenslandica TaxID=400682 RepID=A0A1X7TV03_AMPQE
MMSPGEWSSILELGNLQPLSVPPETEHGTFHKDQLLSGTAAMPLEEPILGLEFVAVQKADHACINAEMDSPPKEDAQYKSTELIIEDSESNDQSFSLRQICIDHLEVELVSWYTKQYVL